MPAGRRGPPTSGSAGHGAPRRQSRGRTRIGIVTKTTAKRTEVAYVTPSAPDRITRKSVHTAEVVCAR